MPITQAKIEKMLKQACFDCVVTCPYCGAPMEPDAKKCYKCNENNPLIEEGYI
jgi:ribosomal protein L40E